MHNFAISSKTFFSNCNFFPPFQLIVRWLSNDWQRQTDLRRERERGRISLQGSRFSPAKRLHTPSKLATVQIERDDRVIYKTACTRDARCVLIKKRIGSLLDPPGDYFIGSPHDPPVYPKFIARGRLLVHPSGLYLQARGRSCSAVAVPREIEACN